MKKVWQYINIAIMKSKAIFGNCIYFYYLRNVFSVHLSHHSPKGLFRTAMLLLLGAVQQICERHNIHTDRNGPWGYL